MLDSQHDDYKRIRDNTLCRFSNFSYSWKKGFFLLLEWYNFMVQLVYLVACRALSCSHLNKG
ncbi:hypothetical protein PVAP13_1KG321515 [Panicum virgatum]|uniref:Uncharacterized protein n=1 Tax=Panicum virgatum TaxID=38727 RepID=A0A8T0XNT7_PANVG|nr:hypothetical protein PVAP13_1KG321515 [Panicum virgatum]